MQTEVLMQNSAKETGPTQGANVSCPICGSEQLNVINTYKNIWFSCTSCRNISRRSKTKLLVRSLPKALDRWKPNLKTFLLKYEPWVETSSKRSTIYDYEWAFDSGIEGKGTKYEKECEFYDKRFDELEINISGKKIIDISGGPGFLCAHLKKRAARVVMTEYSAMAVDLAREKLKLEAFQYDFNTHSLESVLEQNMGPEKFDIVLCRFAINFCWDLKAFIRSVEHVLAPGGIVYLSYVKPTLGACMRWQFQDMTYNMLYTPETVTRMLEDRGFKLKQETMDAKPFFFLKGLEHRWIYMPYSLPAMVKSFIQRDANNVLVQDHIVQLFQKT
jgi:2-polyprenyl-3-methyl-5-hydroxy-6-metoxy-1,4-benzoquinol methylase